MKLRLRTRTTKEQVVLALHVDYAYSDIVQSIDQALLEQKRVAIITTDNQEHRLDLRQFGAIAITKES